MNACRLKSSAFSASSAFLLVGTPDACVVTYVTSTGQSNLTIPVSLSVGQGLSISGPLTFDAQGFFGGPFEPSSVTNQLRNGTAAPLTWAAVVRDDAARFVNLSQTGGTLSPGETTTVVASLDSIANTDTYPYARAGDIWFTNLTSGVASQSHPFSLSISHRFSVSPNPCCTNFYSGGLAGGPFRPGSMTFVLRNETSLPQSWTVTHNNDWLSVSNTTGTLAPGASTNIALSISAAANSLPPNVNAYVDTLIRKHLAFPASCREWNFRTRLLSC